MFRHLSTSRSNSPSNGQRRTAGTRLLHSIVLLAALALLGGQLVEANHYHAGDETGSHCLFCTQTADSAIPVSPVAVVTAGQVKHKPLIHTVSAAHEPTLLPPTRAPPHIA